jgi:hypothetical protein
MTRSMRSRFNEPTPRPPQRPQPPQRPRDDDDDYDPRRRAQKPATIVGQIFLIMVIGILGYMAYDWQSHDISGEYQAVTRYLGVVRLSLVRKATTVSGEMVYGHGNNLIMTNGSFTDEKHLQMAFASNPQFPMPETGPESATLDAIVQDGTITGTIEAAGRTLDIRLTKNSIASFYRGIQAHLPWAQ